MKKLVFCLMILLATKVVCQIKAPQINVGIAYRGIPETISGGSAIQSANIGISYDRINHYKGYNFNINLIFPIGNKNWYLQLANYGRYGHMKYENIYGIPWIFDTTELNNFKTDHFLDVLKKISLGKKKKAALQLGLGFGIMNTNTKYSWQQLIRIDAAGNRFYQTRSNSLDFFSKRFIIGYSYNKINFSVIAHEAKLIFNPTAYNWWLEANLNYSFSIFKKKSK